MSKRKNAQGDAVRSAILTEIKDYFNTHGYAPTLSEIGDAVGLKSTATVAHHIAVLTEDGVLETDEGVGSARAIRVRGMQVVFPDKEITGKERMQA